MCNSIKKSLFGVDFCSEKIIGPYFFEDNDGKAVSMVTVTELCDFEMHKLSVEGLYFHRIALHAIHRLPQSLLCVKC